MTWKDASEQALERWMWRTLGTVKVRDIWKVVEQRIF